MTIRLDLIIAIVTIIVFGGFLIGGIYALFLKGDPEQKAWNNYFAGKGPKPPT